MASETNPVVRGNTSAFAKFAENVEADVRLSQHRSLFVQKLEPDLMEFARIRRLYGANTGAGAALAPVTALPTTTATWILYNPTSNNRVFVPLRAYCWGVSGTLGLGMALLLGAPNDVVATAPTLHASSVNKALMPKSQGTSAIFGSAATIAAPVWNVMEARSQVSAVEVGSGLVTDIKGMYLIEPGYGLAGAVLAPVGTTALFGFGLIWGELDLTMGA